MPSVDPRSHMAHEAVRGLLSAQLTDQVLARYDEPWRVYHNRAHPLAIFCFARYHGFALSRAQALAILFHDVVYELTAKRGENERASAQLLRTLCGHLPVGLVDAAAQMVLDTIDHTASSTESALVLDLDLSPFVISARGEIDASRLVWLEYRELLPADDTQAAAVFWKARSAVLKRFLAKPSIFVSAEFKGFPGLERDARAHLEQELTRGELGLVP